ncbi:MAG TPA: outer membrane protein [Xanthobacteraceae bacterium]|jgi:outer membrane immunogenic protein|nr:outer membrane protein [Xanthobacteraceae bacterium]
MSKNSQNRKNCQNRLDRIALVPALVLLGLAVAAPARAADLSVAPIYKAPPVVATPAYNWSGFYLGVNGGGGWGTSNWDSAGSFNLSGGVVGGTAGVNWQMGHAVLGLEGDVDWSNLKGTSTAAGCPAGCTTNNDWLSTVRGRAGYAFDRFMPYVTGGLAVGDIKAGTPGFTGATQTNAGWTAGGGIEFALTNNWTAKAEYLHVDLGNMNCGFNCGGVGNNNVSLKSDLVRGGVNFRFGGGN